MASSDRHLPLYGVGPFYGVGIIAATAVGILLSRSSPLAAGRIPALRLPFLLAGLALLALGFVVWAKAAFRIDKYITANRLCTDGIYAFVRNPCYSGILLMCTGALLLANNLFLLPLPFVYWLALTVLLKHTEEKWLYDLYGQEYLDYCKRVNRCIPWPPH